MKRFMDADFLLENDVAKKLYHESAKDEPILDYHCHLNPAEIAENKKFDNLSEIWLGGDHYKWRAMRSVGIEEHLITGDADPYDKFLAWAKTMPQLLGNPLYHWSHLELQRYFDIYEPFNLTSAPSIWEMTKEKLQSDELSVKGIFSTFNVAAVGTTDDPISSMNTHNDINKGLASIGSISTKVLPSFRPDKAILIENPGFPQYIESLSKSAEINISCVEDLLKALQTQLSLFVDAGCKATDHGLPMVPYEIMSAEKVEEIFQKRMNGEDLTQKEAEAFGTRILLFLGKEYAKVNIVMQLHVNAIRNLNPPKFKTLGPDTGYDASHDLLVAQKLSQFLGALEKESALPKTILYSLNPKDYYSMGTIMGAFQGDGIKGKIQLGSGWWFCDHKDGMVEQLTTLANLGSLPRFIGMLTDSRSFLSYPRHEYFRRILANLLGTWVEHGEIPHDSVLLDTVMKDISYRNAKEYFRL
jgi:glucuronate isomerase